MALAGGATRASKLAASATAPTPERVKFFMHKLLGLATALPLYAE
jgi:hypothetical protein